MSPREADVARGGSIAALEAIVQRQPRNQRWRIHAVLRLREGKGAWEGDWGDWQEASSIALTLPSQTTIVTVMAGKESRRPQARDTGLVGNNSAPIRALAGMASLRLGVAGWIGLAGPWLTSAWTIGGALVLLDRMWLGFAAPAWILVATPVVVAALVTAVMAWVRTPSRLVALSLVDSRLGLHDALASGAALSAEANEDAFAQLAVHDAAAQAAQVRLRAGAPVQLTNWWGVWPIAAIAATAIVVWTPDAAAQRRERVEEQRLTQEQASQQARNAIAAAATAVVSDEDVADNAAAPAVDSADGQDARFLKRLEEELSTGDVTPDEARTQAAKRVQKTAQRSAKQAAQGGALTEALSRRFSGLQSSEKNMNNMDSSEMQALREALARGDARQAAESIRLLEEKLAKVDDATRHQIADEISRLSKQLEEQSATATDKTPAQSTTDPTAPLRDAGLSKDEAKQLLEETQDADQLRDALRQRGVDEPTASKAAQQAEDLEQRRDMDRQAEKTHDEVKKALDGASRKMREQPESAQRDNSRQDGAAKPSDATKPSDESAQDENAQDERESASRTAKPADSRRKTDESNESARQTHGAKRPGQTQGEPKRISTQRSPAPGQPGAPSDAKQEEGAQQAVDSPESKPGAKAGESQDNRGSTSAPQAERNKGQDTQGETPAAVKEENPDEKSVKDGADMQRNAD